ncbi:MAG TPA: hypothetical protein EYO33_02140 [Phycisphaerales bacterium]|nr:hypothetical protein [Phycisphaerales bacterium]
MARASRRNSRTCAICSQTLYGFDDDMELGIADLPSEHRLSAFSGRAMCGPCFESWDHREAFGSLVVDRIRSQTANSTNAEIYNDENSLVLLNVGVEALSWKPVHLKNKEEYQIVVWLRPTGTDLVIPLEQWPGEKPEKRDDKRLRASEQAALDAIWPSLVSAFPTAQSLLAQVDVDKVISDHQNWLAQGD